MEKTEKEEVDEESEMKKKIATKKSLAASK